MGKIVIYTDGAASMKCVNGEYTRCNGGAAMAIINEHGKIEYSASKHFENTTNNFCELSAILMALSYCSVNYPQHTIEIYSDSAYCVNMLKPGGWIYSWEKNGWTRGKKHEPIENLEIIQAIWSLMQNIDVTFIKVIGHSGNPYNEYVDKLAVQAKTDDYLNDNDFRKFC